MNVFNSMTKKQKKAAKSQQNQQPQDGKRDISSSKNIASPLSPKSKRTNENFPSSESQAALSPYLLSTAIKKDKESYKPDRDLAIKDSGDLGDFISQKPPATSNGLKTTIVNDRPPLTLAEINSRSNGLSSAPNSSVTIDIHLPAEEDKKPVPKSPRALSNHDIDHLNLEIKKELPSEGNVSPPSFDFVSTKEKNHEIPLPKSQEDLLPSAGSKLEEHQEDSQGQFEQKKSDSKTEEVDNNGSTVEKLWANTGDGVGDVEPSNDQSWGESLENSKVSENQIGRINESAQSNEASEYESGEDGSTKEQRVVDLPENFESPASFIHDPENFELGKDKSKKFKNREKALPNFTQTIVTSEPTSVTDDDIPFFADPYPFTEENEVDDDPGSLSKKVRSKNQREFWPRIKLPQDEANGLPPSNWGGDDDETWANYPEGKKRKKENINDSRLVKLEPRAVILSQIAYYTDEIVRAASETIEKYIDDVIGLPVSRWLLYWFTLASWYSVE
ncbi:hypothetical protein G9A89_007900 [Geosiphon pyriformis]|nr:hypothetical protein G9A89_007900 [Geosiphon pyriformis]